MNEPEEEGKTSTSKLNNNSEKNSSQLSYFGVTGKGILLTGKREERIVKHK